MVNIIDRYILVVLTPTPILPWNINKQMYSGLHLLWHWSSWEWGKGGVNFMLCSGLPIGRA